MKAYCWRWLAPVLLVGAVCCTGCDLASLAYFLVPEGQEPPKCGPIVDPNNKKKEVKAMILVLSQGLETRSETMQADRQLAVLLFERLSACYKANGENVVLTPLRKLEDFKVAHPNWKSLSPARIGELFKVDHVIVLDITSFSVLTQGGMLAQGQADISVNLVNVQKPDEVPAPYEVHCTYPSVAVDTDSDFRSGEFRQKFLNAITKKLTAYFAAHSPRQKSDMDEDHDP